MYDPVSDNEDEQMARAIEESLAALKDTKRQTSKTASDEEFDADLERALAASKAEAVTVHEAPPPSNPAADFLRQRALLERERLARSKKRNHTVADNDDSSEEGKRPNKRRSPPTPPRPSTSEAKMPAQASASTSEGELFWKGELRQTANRFTEANDTMPTFRISQLIGDKTQIQFAMLSSYCTMVPWVYEFFLPETPVILVNQPDEDGNSGIRRVLPTWIMTKPFLRSGRGAMHIKFMIVFYKSGRMRLIIPTANLVDYDWRDIENSAWVQDFPRLARTIPHNGKATDFAATLQFTLRSLNIAEALRLQVADYPSLPIHDINEIRQKWDFSKVTVKLIPSISGKHEGWDQVIRQGQVALMKAVNDIGASVSSSKRPLGSQLIVECQGSSIGTYSTTWLSEIFACFQGISVDKTLGISKTARAKAGLPSGLKILFPSLKTVDDSILGRDGAGTMFCRRSQWNGQKFPRELFYDSNSKRGGVMMHSKMILALWKERGTTKVEKDDDETEEESDDDDVKIIEPSAAGWLYVGSHNFTPSAWGTLSGTSFTPVLNITNYELGVMIPLHEKAKEAEQRGNELACWRRPARKYVPGKDVPWMQEDHTE